MKVGKLPPRHDVRTLRFGRYNRALPSAPASCDYSLKVPAWPMLGNDQYGDCTFAGAAHLSQCWADNAGRPFTPDDRAVVAEYLSFTAGADSGCVELDVLKHWRVNGIVDHKIGAFAALDHGEREHLMQTTYLFGGAYLGVALPLSAEDQAIWDVPPQGPIGRGSPGSWGGHCVVVVAYNPTGPIVVTWGQLMQMTWDFFDTYVDEAYAILAQDFLSDANIAPNGFDVAALAADLALVGQMESPPFAVPPVNPPAPNSASPSADDVRAKVRTAFDAEIKSAQGHLYGRFLVSTMAHDAQLADTAVVEAFNGQ
jgi:hypothetical protein